MPLNQNQYLEQVHSLYESRQLESSCLSEKPQLNKQRTKLFYFLQKINDQPVSIKRQCIINYLNNDGELKDLQKSIKTIEKQVSHIPALEVAISLGKHNKNVLAEFLQSNKNKRQKLKLNRANLLVSGNNSFVQLLNIQPESNNIKPPSKQPSFHEYKVVSPTKVKEIMIGKSKTNKKQMVKHIQYPKQLYELKKQLYSLPCLGKQRIKTQNNPLNSLSQKPSQIRHLSQLNMSFRSSGSFNKNKKQFIEKQKALENTLNQVLQNRLSSINVQNKKVLPSLKSSLQGNFKMGQNTISAISVNSKFEFNSLERNISIYSNSQQNPENISLLKCKRVESLSRQIKIHNDYWPVYKQYSPHNNIKLQQQSEHLKKKMHSLMDFSEMPNEQTIKMYFNFKKFQQQDLQELKQYSLQEEKGFSVSKYRIKFRQIKQNNKRNFMQYAKQKKRKNFQQQKLDMMELNNMSKRPLKLNSKLLERVKLSASDFISNI